MAKPKTFPNDIHFTPGQVLGPWIEKFRKKHSLEKPQDAIRQILRDRKRQEEEGANK